MMIKYYAADTLKEKTINHGFFTRLGGHSTGVYAGLNCGLGSDDDPEIIMQNRGLVTAEMSCSPPNLLSPYQVHGVEAICAAQPFEGERPKADALLTDQPGLAISVVTADCAPVLFLGKKEDGAPIIAAAHAGWKGALFGVLENTIDAMNRLGAESIKAAIGPCIQQQSYEVSKDFSNPFLKEDAASAKYFDVYDGAPHFDLSGYCAHRLKRSGIKDISTFMLDTYTNEEEFYSFRRATHKQEKEYGRQISVIVIKE